MRSLCYHGHTKCVDQGLSLLTPSLIFFWYHRGSRFTSDHEFLFSFFKMAGRPCSKFEVNLSHIDETLERIKLISVNPTTRNGIRVFSKKLFDMCNSFEEKGTQTNDLNEDNVLDDVLSLTDESMGFILRNIWQNLNKG